MHHMQNVHAFVHRFHNPDAGILLLRIALGIVFIYHGWMKFSAMEPTIGFFASLGLAPIFAYITATAEVAGGLAFLAGIFARYAGVVLTVMMAAAIWLVHISNGFNVANGGYEFALVLMLGSAAIVTFGSGAYSLAAYLRKN